MGKTKEPDGSGNKKGGLEKIKSNNKAKQQQQRDANKKDQQDTLNLLYPDGLPKELSKARHAEVILNGVKKLVSEKATLEQVIAKLKQAHDSSAGRITLCEKTLRWLEHRLANGGLRQLLQLPNDHLVALNKFATPVGTGGDDTDDKIIAFSLDPCFVDALLGSLPDVSQNYSYNGDDSLSQSVDDEGVEPDQKTEEDQGEDSGKFEGADDENANGQVPNVDQCDQVLPVDKE